MDDESEWTKWYLISDGGAFSVRRYKVTDRNKQERYPKEKYKHLKTRQELGVFLERLNHRRASELERARLAYKFKHRFITQDVLDDFREKLEAEVTAKAYARNLYRCLEENALHWFINIQGKPDPIEWKRLESKWGVALRGGELFDDPISPDYLKKQAQVLNRFLKYLHQRMPQEVPAIIIEPTSKAVMLDYKARYKAGGDGLLGKYIEDAHWKVIERDIDQRIKPFVQLGYYFGLRRAESLAVLKEHIMEGCLDVCQQLTGHPDGEPVYGPTKNRKDREVPYWFVTPDYTYEVVTSVNARMHYCYYGELFGAEMRRLGYDYTSHDLRRTFITRALRAGHLPRDIQLAVGHSDLQTTMRYAQDDRALNKRQFVPKKAS